MTTTTQASPLPWTVKTAAALLVVYGVWVIVNATLGQMATGWVDRGDYPRAFIRLGGMLLTAYGLFRRERWGWWLGVLMPSFFLLTVLVGGGLVVTAGQEAEMALELRQLVVPAVCLALAVGLLLAPSSRAAFRRTQ